MDVLIFERERVIRQQQEAIRELSTPVRQVRDGLLILPIIGALDTRRARQLALDLLDTIRARRAKVVVMDITGVPGALNTAGDLQGGLEAAERMLGYSVTWRGAPNGKQPITARSG